MREGESAREEKLLVISPWPHPARSLKINIAHQLQTIYEASMEGIKTKQLLSKDGSIHVTDEVCNTVISALGALLSIIGSVFLVVRAQLDGNFWQMIAFLVYGFGLVCTFVFSALHHGVNGSPQTNHLLRQFDYFAIYIMIAGTFTPFCLVLLRNPLGWTVLGIVWGLAIMGIILKAFVPHVPKWVSLFMYIGMGWLSVVIINPLYQAVHWEGIFVLFLGGFFFTVGGLIYGLEKPNPFPGKFGFHEIWHCLVLCGAASHFYLMARYL